VTNGTNKSTSSSNGPRFGTELGQALEVGQFFLVYQPTIDLQTNAFAGVEALIRWRHPTRGVLNPVEFLSELEQSGEIVPVGRWALITACAQGAAWHERGYRFPVSVNIATKQFDDPAFDTIVDEALTSSQLDPMFLILEFPFSILHHDKGNIAPRLELLHELGVRLAIDDLRPSTAALTTLESFPISVVKLDRSFIAEIPESSSAQSLVLELVQMAKTRRLQIVASGIEDAEQRERLQLNEVNTGQGFFFSEPHEASDIDTFLEDFSIFSGKPL
jgi:EAL domain-containing protein (putative c-di-GMP-specific phosphodiesterase class I)